VTRLRKLMLEELQRRNYSESTIRGYLRAVEGFAKHFGKSPDELGPEELRQYQLYLLRDQRPGCFRVWPKADEWTDTCTTKPCGGRSSAR
jgi:hypothetical protein